MARLEFFLVSESVSIDQATNQASIFNVIEQINVEQFPIAISCVALSLWWKEEGDEEKDFQTLLKLMPPGGEAFELTSNFRMMADRHRVMSRIQGLPIKQEGILRFEILLNGKHAANHDVSVLKVDPVDSGEVAGSKKPRT